MKNFRYHFLSLLVTLLVAGSFLSSAKLSGVINAFSLTRLWSAIAAKIMSQLYDREIKIPSKPISIIVLKSEKTL